MNKKIKKIINITLIPFKIMLVLALIYFSYEGLNKVFYNRDVMTSKDYLALPENSLDVLVLGSSDSQYSFIPPFFYEDTGLVSYVRGTACQPLKVSYEMLKDSLKTQQPKMVILEVFTAMPLRSICFEDSCFVIAEYQMSGDEKYNTIGFLPEEKAQNYLNDFFNYHNDWRTLEDPLSVLTQTFKYDNKKLGGMMGYIYQADPDERTKNRWYPTVYDEFVDMALDDEDLEALNNIYDLCVSKGMELMLYKTPIDGITVEDQSALYKVWEWADDHMVEYYDFVDRAPQLDFYMQQNSDSFHCFLSGANIITTKLAEIVNRDYDLESSVTAEIETEYNDDASWLMGKLMTGDLNGGRWLKRLSKTKGYILVDYKPYNYLSDELYESLIEMGCSNFDRSQNYKAIIRNGVLLDAGVEPVEVMAGETKLRVGRDSMHFGDSSCKLNASLTIGYSYGESFSKTCFSSIGYTGEGWVTGHFH